MIDALHTIATLARSADLLAIRDTLAPDRVIQDAIAIQQIPAPTFDEGQRAAAILERFRQAGLHDVAQDDLFNVFGRLPGSDPTCPALLLSAHTDTVFPSGTDLSTRQDGERVYGPGLGDNSLGVASLLAVLDLLRAHRIQPVADIWFVANSREEGLGDLGGIRAVWNRLRDRLGAAIVIEGMALGRIYHAGIAVRRLRIACRAPGGHSWLHFGQPSAVHGLVQLGAAITAIAPPAEPRTTYNIGLISGGHSVNSLATHAELYLDLRSEDPATLSTLEAQVRRAADNAAQPGLSFTIDVVGDRPAGQIATHHPLVKLAAAALDAIDHPVTYERGSTDANVLLANGLPAVTIGITYGAHAHRLDEYIETAPIAGGIWQLLLLTLSAAGQLHTWGR